MIPKEGSSLSLLHPPITTDTNVVSRLFDHFQKTCWESTCTCVHQRLISTVITLTIYKNLVKVLCWCRSVQGVNTAIYYTHPKASQVYLAYGALTFKQPPMHNKAGVQIDLEVYDSGYTIHY